MPQTNEAVPPSEVVDRMPPKGRRKHSWDEWFDGRVHKLTRGTHYTCKEETMAAAARKAGERRGLDVDTSYNCDSGNVWIQKMGPLEAH